MLSEEFIFERLVTHLSPWENMLVKIQMILTWQNPKHSCLYLCLVESILVFTCFINNNSIFLCLFFIWLLILLDCINNYIWPTVKVPEVTDNMEPWTSLDPHVMNVQELSLKLSKVLSYVLQKHHTLAHLRKNNRLAFGFISGLSLAFIAYLGTYIWGRTLFFLICNFCLALPAMSRFKMCSRFTQAMEPYWHRMRLELERHEKFTTELAEKEEAQFVPDTHQWQRILETELDPDISERADEEYIQNFIPRSPNHQSSTFDTDEEEDLQNNVPFAPSSSLNAKNNSDKLMSFGVDTDDDIDASFEIVDYKP